MNPHLGAELAAYVDGELDHGARERVLRHLGACPPCRTEVDEQSRLKARLLGMGDTGPAPTSDLAARLRALPGSPGLAGPYAATRPAGGRPPRGPRRRGRTRTVVGGAVIALGLGAVMMLGTSPRTSTRTPVDPDSGSFLIEHASTAAELPFPGSAADPGR